MAVISIHGGHASYESGKYYGAVGTYLNESVEDRKVKDAVIRILRQKGHTVYDDTVDKGISQTNILSQICSKVNSRTNDLAVSIHFNSATSPAANGTEVWVYSKTSKALNVAKSVVNRLATLGFTNRGIKYSTTLFFLRRTKCPAMLIEVCFVGSDKDHKIYDVEKTAKAIAEGIIASL